MADFGKDLKQACDDGYADGQRDRWISVDDALPESGNHVLVCCQIHRLGGGLRNYVCIAFYSDDKSIPCGYYDDIDSVYDEETDEYYFPVGWWEVIHNWEDYSCVAIEDFVTHWMPLPKPTEVGVK